MQTSALLFVAAVGFGAVVSAQDNTPNAVEGAACTAGLYQYGCSADLQTIYWCPSGTWEFYSKCEESARCPSGGGFCVSD
ncbi:hypothetical protein F4778DRAFT_785417 [Xylariomycetidae sp. FL2044]|nr:hypothetical protein F4778DRAFT_785417 [Xylariomycetidae sp. FL2044]